MKSITQNDKSKSKSKTKSNTNTKSNTSKNTLIIYGFDGCGYFESAVKHAHTYKSLNPNIELIINSVPKSKWPNIIETYSISKGLTHKTSPLIFYNAKYIGGHDAFLAQLQKNVAFS